MRPLRVRGGSAAAINPLVRRRDGADRTDVKYVVTALLNLVRPRRKQAPAEPMPALRPPLPAKLLAELAGMDAMRNRRHDDRRRRPRLDHDGDIAVDAELPAGRTTVAAHVCDMSAEGMSFTARAPLPPGTLFHTTLVQMNGDGLVDLTCTVRRCDAQADGRYLIGGAFVAYRAYGIEL